MKNNNHVQKFIKSSLSKLSPTNKSKSNKYNNFNLTSFKNNDFTKFISSPKRTKEEVILPKKRFFLIQHIIEKLSPAHRIIFNIRI